MTRRSGLVLALAAAIVLGLAALIVPGRLGQAPHERPAARSPATLVLAAPAANGGQGGSLDLAGMPHTGRIRIYSSAAGCQMAARAW